MQVAAGSSGSAPRRPSRPGCPASPDGRSVTLPALRNFGDQPANGPNSSQSCPLITRVSRWRRHRRAPSGGRPYTWRRARRRECGIEVRSHCRRPGTRRSPWLLDARLLQQRQRVTSGADEHEPALQLAVSAGAPVDDLHRPAPVGLPRSITSWPNSVDMPRSPNRAAVATATRSRRRCRRRSSSARPARRSPARRHQRQPAGEFVGVVDELHRGEQGWHQRVPAAQVVACGRRRARS